MEVVGLTVSIASLAALFQIAVDCFEYVELGRSFGVDYQTSRLRLDSAHLRLTRWGEAVGLGRDTEAMTALRDVSVPQKDVKHAEDLLGHILILFQKAEERSKKLDASPGSTQGTADGDRVDSGTGLTAAGQSLRQRMLEICHRRQKKTSAAKKAKWAIYGRVHFNEVISDITELLDALIDLFPATAPVLQGLCEQEARDLIHEKGLPQLRETATSQDRLLENAIDKLLKRDVSQFRAFKIDDIADLRQARQVSYTVNNSDNTKVMNQVLGDQTINGRQTFNFN